MSRSELELPSLSSMYEAIGRAVGAAQIFEAVIVVCSEFVRISKDSLAGNESDGLVNPKRFKVATKLLLKQLAQTNDIAPEFETRVAALVDKRHTLIHRWYVENGWPGEHDAEEIVKLTTLAQEVESECLQITATLAGYILKVNEDFEDIRKPVTDLFKNVT